MAIQDGILKFKGRIGDLSFYKTKDGYGVRKSDGIDGNRIKNDPAFQRTRENGVEFGHAGRSVKVLRNALRVYTKNATDRHASRRLTKLIMEVIHSDTTNPRGKRVVTSGDLSLLRGFNFNESGALAKTLFVKPVMAIDRSAGTFTANIPPFVPLNDVLPAPGATHLRLTAIAVEIDFEQQHYVAGSAQSELIALGHQEVPATALIAAATPNSTLPMILLVGLQFVQVLGDTEYPLNNGAFNSLAIVEVSNG